LVVIAIIAILAAILFPVFAKAREKARSSACLSNLKQMGNAGQLYLQDWDDTFPNAHFLGRIWTLNNVGPAKTPTSKYFVELIAPYVKSNEVFYCPSTGPDFVWQGTFTQPFSENLSSYWYNYWRASGTALGDIKNSAASILLADMPYGPDYPLLPHSHAINIGYADGHAKLYHVTDKDLPNRKGTWWDQVHGDDGWDAGPYDKPIAQ
jgi:prepilin-type processing-associated H-X9-DG protein